MKKIKVNSVQVVSCDYIGISTDEGYYFSDDSIMDFKEKFDDLGGNYDVYYYGHDSGNYYTLEQMENKFKDFKYEDQYQDDSFEVFSYIIIPSSPIELNVFQEIDRHSSNQQEVMRLYSINDEMDEKY
jgi:sortase (surface protein transpeptidase)